MKVLVRNSIVSAVFIAAMLASDHANAINCVLRTRPLNFGNYAPLSPAHIDVLGRVLVFCWGSPGTFAVVMGPGNSGNQMARTLSTGTGQLLDYGIYRDAARTQVWGDGIPPTFVINGSRPRNGWPTFAFYSVYGRLYANQAPDPGNYSDDVTATVLF